MSSGVLLGALGRGSAPDLLGLRWSFVLIGIVVFALSMLAVVRFRSGADFPGSGWRGFDLRGIKEDKVLVNYLISSSLRD